MHDDRSLDLQGRWWLPGQAYADGIPGTLRFDPNDGGTLTLNGHLRRHEEFGVTTSDGDTMKTAFSEESMERAGTYEFIHGQAENKAFTLYDAFQSSSDRTLGGQDSREIVTVNRIYRGAWFGPPGPMTFDRTVVGMKHLVQWVDPRQITRSYVRSENEGGIDLCARNHRADDSFITADGVSIQLVRRIGESGDKLASFTLTQDCDWKIQAPTVVDEKRLLDWAGWLQDLVSIGTGRTAQFGDVTFHHPDVTSRGGPPGSDERRVDIDYFGRWSARDTSGEPASRPRDHLFGFDHIDGMDGVQKWLAVAPTYRAALGRIGASRYTDGQYVSDILLHRTAALESFDRIRTGYNQSNLRTRLKRCVAAAADEVAPFINDLEVWLTGIVEARNDAAHQLDPVADDSIDFMLVESLYWLFLICIMKEAGFAEKALRKLTHSARYVWLSGRVFDLTTP